MQDKPSSPLLTLSMGALMRENKGAQSASNCSRFMWPRTSTSSMMHSMFSGDSALALRTFFI